MTAATDTEASVAIARGLWEIGAIKLAFEQRFRLPHALPSPMFIDTRRIFSEPSMRELAVDELSRRVGVLAGEAGVDLIAGDETAGIPLAAWVAWRQRRGMVYLRKTAKKHGLPNLIEGGDVAARRVAVVTDLVNVGSSLIPGLTAMQEAGAEIVGVTSLIKRSPVMGYEPYRHLGVVYQGVVDARLIVETGARLRKLDAQTRTALLGYLEEASRERIYERGRPQP